MLPQLDHPLPQQQSIPPAIDPTTPAPYPRAVPIPLSQADSALPSILTSSAQFLPASSVAATTTSTTTTSSRAPGASTFAPQSPLSSSVSPSTPSVRGAQPGNKVYPCFYCDSKFPVGSLEVAQAHLVRDTWSETLGQRHLVRDRHRHTQTHTHTHRGAHAHAHTHTLSLSLSRSFLQPCCLVAVVMAIETSKKEKRQSVHTAERASKQATKHGEQEGKGGGYK